MTTKEKSISKKQLTNMIREMVRREIKARKKIQENKKRKAKSATTEKISVAELRKMVRQSLREAVARKKKSK